MKYWVQADLHVPVLVQVVNTCRLAHNIHFALFRTLSGNKYVYEALHCILLFSVLIKVDDQLL
jgi:hypothetical protein